MCALVQEKVIYMVVFCKRDELKECRGVYFWKFPIFGSWRWGVHCCILRNASAQHEVWRELLGLLVWAFRAVLPAPGDIWGSGPYLAWILRPGGTFHPQNSCNRGSMAIWGAFMSYRPFWACELPKLPRLWYFDWFLSCRGNLRSLFELQAI